MKPVNDTKQIIIASIIVTFGFGFLIGVLFDGYVLSKKFIFANEIQIEFDVVGIFSLLVTVVIAFLVGRILSQKDGQERLEKETIIDYLRVFDTEFTAKMRKITKDGNKLTHVTGVLRRHRMRAKKLIELATKHRLISDESEFSRQLDTDIKEIIDLMTETPKKGEVANGVEVVSGKLKFSDKQIDLIVAKVFDVGSSVFDLLVEINRHQR